MIRKLVAAAAAVAALATAPAASAAEKDGVRVGLGIGIAPFTPHTLEGVLVAPPVGIYVPIDLSAQFRLEPSLGFWTYSQDSDSVPVNAIYSSNAWDLGVGAFYLLPQAGGFGAYVGGRLGLVFQGAKRNLGGGASAGISETDFYVKAAFGAEYHFAPKFSLGAEFQLVMRSYGDQKEDFQPTVNRSAISFSTDGLLFARYYF
jgi:outer membrane protein with beta-barrel domain